MIQIDFSIDGTKTAYRETTIIKQGVVSMGTEKGVSEQNSSSEMQGLICTEVLRDWLKHLEHDADDGRRTAVDGTDSEDDAAHR